MLGHLTWIIGRFWSIYSHHSTGVQKELPSESWLHCTVLYRTKDDDARGWTTAATQHHGSVNHTLSSALLGPSCCGLRGFLGEIGSYWIEVMLPAWSFVGDRERA